MKEKEIKIKISSPSGLLWPYFNNEKALSASALTKILKEIEYENKQIPHFVLMKAAENGKIFHQTIQKYLETGDEESYLSLPISLKTLDKIKESLFFFKEKKFPKFLGSERLHHCFYENSFFGSYIDLEFEDFVIELKTNNVIIDQSPISNLIFKIQMLIQQLCTGKDIYLLWSTGKGVYFNKFEKSEEILKILRILISISKNKEMYSLEVKKEMIEKLLKAYAEKVCSKSLLINHKISKLL